MPEPTKVHHSHARLVAVMAATVAIVASAAIAYKSASSEADGRDHISSAVDSTAQATTTAAPDTIPATTSTTEPAPSTTIDETAAACKEIAVALGRLGDQPTKQGGLSDSLSGVATAVGGAAEALPFAPRREALDLSDAIADLAATVESLEAARADRGPDEVAVIDAVIDATPRFSMSMAEGIFLAEASSQLQAECAFESSTPDVALGNMLVIATPLDAFMATGLASEPQFWLLVDIYEGVHEIVELLARPAESEFHTYFAVCGVDAEATELGDNPGCDGLAFACNAGDLAACDDLYIASMLGSEYEEVGATCGGRVDGLIGGVPQGLRDERPGPSMQEPGDCNAG